MADIRSVEESYVCPVVNTDLTLFLSESMTGVDKRVMMGKSACDDGQKGIEKDLRNMESDTSCDKKVGSDSQIEIKIDNLV